MIKSLILSPILAAGALIGTSAGAQMTVRPVSTLPSAPMAVSAAPLSGILPTAALTVGAPASLSAAPLAAPSIAPQAVLPVAAPALAVSPAALDRVASPKEAAPARPVIEIAAVALRDSRVDEMFTGGRALSSLASPSVDVGESGSTPRSALAPAARPWGEPKSAAPGAPRDLTAKEFGIANLLGIAAAVGVGFLTHNFWIGLLGTYVAAIPLILLYVAIKSLTKDKIKVPGIRFAPGISFGGKKYGMK
jgi:hypothetical protein